MKNDHIIDFLNYYCSLTVAPEYAVLVKGPWGCGKSFLVKNFIKKFKKDNVSTKFLNVSLYGISSLEDIETEFFKQLHPFLSSKGAVFAGQLAKGVMKGAFKIDLDGDGKSDATLSAGVPSIKLADYLTDTSECILVFDDLERCEIDKNIVLGFINHFVEKNGHKVIIIADELKISSTSGDKNRSWGTIKEKLIGKSFEVKADISFVYDEIVANVIETQELQAFLEAEKSRLLELFECSKYENLRSLRKLLMDFERLFLALEKPAQENNDLLIRMLDLFTMLSMEIYAGKLESNQIGSLLGSASITRTVRSRDNTEAGQDKYSEIENKYKDHVGFYETLLEIQTWHDLFHKGFIDKKAINEELKNTQYFSSDDAPDWQKLWYLWHIEDKNFNSLYKSVQLSLKKEEFVALGEIKHVYGIFLKLAELKVINENPSEIFEFFKSYIEKASKDKKLLSDEAALSLINGYHDSGYHGLMFHSRETDLFQQLTDILNAAVTEAHQQGLADRSNQVLERIKEHPSNLSSMLSYSNTENHPFQHNAILQNIDVGAFIDALCNVPNNHKRDVCSALEIRFEGVGHQLYLMEEEAWLKKLHERLEDRIKKLDASLTKIALNDCLKSIEAAIQHFENYKESLKKS